MYNVSNAYKTAVYTTPIRSKLAGVITLKNGETIDIYDNLNASNVVKDSVKLNNQCVSQNKLEYGNAYVGQLEISLYNDIDRNKLYGATISLSWYLQTSVNVFEEIPLGVFIISEAVRTKHIVKITAYDNMQLLDAVPAQNETEGTVYEILQYIETETGITLEQTQEEIEALVNGTRFITITETMVYSTFRDIVADIAAMLCCFATMSRTGNLKFVPFSTVEAEIITAGQRNQTNITEKVINYDSLQMLLDNVVYTVVKTGEEIGSSLYTMETVPFISQGHGEAYIKQTLQAMIDEISLLSYTPASFNMVGNPALDLGDGIQLKTGNTIECFMPIMGYEWQYHGASAIKSFGETNISGKSKTEKIISNASEAIESKKTIIFTYENASEIVLNSSFKQIIRLDYVSKAATKGLFEAQILLSNDTAAELTFKYIVNNNEDVLFVPKQTLSVGKHMITLIYPLTNIPKNTANSLRVQATISAGTATIEAQNIKAAVTAQGLAEGVQSWDGTIEIAEIVNPFDIPILPIVEIEELLNVSQIAPAINVISETVNPFSVLGISVITDITEQIGSGHSEEPIDFVITQQTVTFENTDYTETVEGVTKLKTVYVYESEEEEIDDGFLSSVQIMTSDKALVESVVVE